MTTKTPNEQPANPFSARRKFNVPPVESPINNLGVDTSPEAQNGETAPKTRKINAPGKPGRGAKAKKEELVPAQEELLVPPAPTPEAAVSDKPDTEEEAAEIDPKNPFEKTYTNDELLPILDSLLQHGYALLRFNIRGTEIMLRTRFTWEEQYIYQHLENSELNTALNYQREYNFITITASLVKYGDYLFEPINKGKEEELEKSMSDRYEFVRSLNSVVTDIIQLKLGQFDDKQRYIITHFDDLLKAF